MLPTPRRPLRLLAPLAFTALGAGLALLAAGPLNPPAGPVAPSYKTLAEIEPRIAVNATNTPGDATSVFKITAAGSYYLADNITVGQAGKSTILIAHSDVTLDLNGFNVNGTVSAGSPSAHGIATDTNADHVTVRNGTVSRFGGAGVNLRYGSAGGRGFVVENITSESNTGAGVYATQGRVSRCTATSNGGAGIYVGGGVIEACVSNSNGGAGIGGGAGVSVHHSHADNNTGGGINLTEGTVGSCVARDNGGPGFAGSGTFTGNQASGNAGVGFDGHGTFTGNQSSSNQGGGFDIDYPSIVRDNTCTFESPYGIRITGNHCLIEQNTLAYCDKGITVTISATSNRIDGNHVSNNAATPGLVGIEVLGLNNLIIRNTAHGNSAGNYAIGAGNSVAPRVAVVASDGWSGITNANHPWANLGY